VAKELEERDYRMRGSKCHVLARAGTWLQESWWRGSRVHPPRMGGVLGGCIPRRIQNAL